MGRIKKDFSELKKSKPFYLFDLIIYGLVAVIVSAVFLFVFFLKNDSAAQGFYVTYKNEVAAEYRFDQGILKIKDGFIQYFSEKDDGFYFYPDANDKKDYNLIIVDKENKTVYIKEATCAGRDCTAQKVTAQGGFIYCAPHNLKIIPMGLNDPVSG